MKLILIASLALASLVTANPFVGEGVFGGTFTMDAPRLSEADTVYFSPSQLIYANGDFLGVDPLGSWYQPFTFSISGHTFTAGDFVFVADSVAVLLKSDIFLNLTMEGTAFYIGRDPTPATASIAATIGKGSSVGGDVMSITVDAKKVPETGSTLGLMASACAGLFIIRWKRTALAVACCATMTSCQMPIGDANPLDRSEMCFANPGPVCRSFSPMIAAGGGAEPIFFPPGPDPVGPPPMLGGIGSCQ